MSGVGGKYAIVRLRPDPEGGEFVNVGVVLLCASLGYFGYRLASPTNRRALDFFPHLDPQKLQEILGETEANLAAISPQLALGRRLNETEKTTVRRRFQELIRPRDGIIAFSPSRAILAENPDAFLEARFRQLVLREAPPANSQTRRAGTPSPQGEDLLHEVA